MKFILILLFISVSSLFGCGGCIDAYLPSQLTNTSLTKYQTQEQKIHLEI